MELHKVNNVCKPHFARLVLLRKNIFHARLRLA